MRAEAVDFAEQRGLNNIAARGLIKFGHQFLERNEYSSAEGKFKQALLLAERQDAPYARAMSLFSLGSLYMQQRKLDQAMECLQPAYEYYKLNGYRKEVSLALTLLARASRIKGDYESALKVFGEQLEFAEKVGDESQAVDLHGEIGKVLAQQERFVESLNQFDLYYAGSKALGDQLGVGYSQMYRADALWRLGRYVEANEAF
ncbi:MAG: hypothetical protein WKF84_08355 [Pyrinomonadaceae bacterium]